MTLASISAGFGGRTSGAVAVSKPLHVFRGPKSKLRSSTCKSSRHESHNLVDRRPEVRGVEAFQEMFLASRQKFVGMANAILRNREDAEDAVQNAFVSGYLHLRSFEGRSALTTWFTRIVLNAALMVRRKRRSPWASTQPENKTSDDESWTQSIPTSQPDPEVACAEREALQLINQVLGKMKPVLRQAFTMTYYDELSGPEACALLGISAGTFKARLFRAKRKLLNQAQRTLVAPMRSARRLFPDKDAFQSLVARPSNTLSLEAGLS